MYCLFECKYVKLHSQIQSEVKNHSEKRVLDLGSENI